MYQIGRTIYYDKASGLVIHDTGEITTSLPNYEELADNYNHIKALSDRDRETIGELKLDFGQYAEDHAAGGRIERVDLITGEPLFIYPSDPEVPQDPQPSLAKKLFELEQRTKLLEYAAQTTGETLDVHEGAIFDVTKLALGGSPEDL